MLLNLSFSTLLNLTLSPTLVINVIKKCQNARNLTYSPDSKQCNHYIFYNINTECSPNINATFTDTFHCEHIEFASNLTKEECFAPHNNEQVDDNLICMYISVTYKLKFLPLFQLLMNWILCLPFTYQRTLMM